MMRKVSQILEFGGEHILKPFYIVDSQTYFYLVKHDQLLSVCVVQLAGTAKSRFSAKDYSDHMALVRAYEGWKDAEREGSAYEYCWRNFLSAQTLQAIHSLRKQFSYILRDAGLIDVDASNNNQLSHNQSLVRAVICSGLFPGISSVVVKCSYLDVFSLNLSKTNLSTSAISYHLCSTERHPCLSKQWMMAKFYYMR